MAVANIARIDSLVAIGKRKAADVSADPNAGQPSHQTDVTVGPCQCLLTGVTYSAEPDQHQADHNGECREDADEAQRLAEKSARYTTDH